MEALDRPFDRGLLRRAKNIAAAYRMIVRFEDGDYYAEGLELPGVMADGKTPDECIRNAREAMTAVVAHLLELGQTPPAPANESRTEQVNIRLSPLEKQRIEAAATSKGFRGIADYVRATVMDRRE
jgi:predicted RNase H-like HicB family nuclease